MDTQLLVVGAGPYGLSTAALALEHDIDTVVLGRPMDFWKTNMPAGMFLRSGLDWHLDAAGIHTLAAYLEERAIAAGDVDPIPIGVFLDYAEWFRKAKRIKVREELTVDLDKRDGRFTATLENGEQIVTDAVVCAPGIRHYTTVPDWASDVPPGRAAHTCDLVRFDEMAGQRVLIVGGRQSAYEWAALVREHGAARIDIVHRHDVPRFEQVSWRFVDEHVQRTLSMPGYWRNLATCQQQQITQRFWEVGALDARALADAPVGLGWNPPLAQCRGRPVRCSGLGRGSGCGTLQLGADQRRSGDLRIWLPRRPIPGPVSGDRSRSN